MNGVGDGAPQSQGHSFTLHPAPVSSLTHTPLHTPTHAHTPFLAPQDFFQLLSPRVSLLRLTKNSGRTEQYTLADFQLDKGLTDARLWADVLALQVGRRQGGG